MAGKTAAAVANVGILFTQESGNPSDALALFKKHEVDISHIESRGSTKCPGCHDFIVLCDPNCNGYTKAVKQLKDMVKSMEMLQDGEDDDVPWFPKHISDLDRFANQVLDCGKELEADHPGFTDQEYRKRRKYYADLAIKYRHLRLLNENLSFILLDDVSINVDFLSFAPSTADEELLSEMAIHGEPIPRVEYTEDEIKTWTYIYNQLVSLYPTNACKEFNEAFPLLQEKCGYGPDNIPQLQDISEFLRDQTGFILRPVAGLLSSRDFLAGLAFRVFHATQYIRHGSKPLYTPEPDICHELLGHVPMFADPGFAQFSQEIGLASLGAPEEDIKKLATLYWFTIEFGLCREGNNIKAYGAGLLSSFGEIQYCLTDEPEKREFDPVQAADQEYPITRYQPIYYVADSFESAKEKMKAYAATIPRSFNIQYNPFTHSVEVINTAKGVTDLVKRLHEEATLLENTLSKLRSFR